MSRVSYGWKKESFSVFGFLNGNRVLHNERNRKILARDQSSKLMSSYQVCCLVNWVSCASDESVGRRTERVEFPSSKIVAMLALRRSGYVLKS